MDTTPAAPLARFRGELYQRVLSLRRDALFELLDAVLTDEQATSLVRHSLAPCFRRGWASAPDALSDGSLDVAALRRLFAATMPAVRVDERVLWVLDGTLWPRPAAKTSPERTWGRFVTGGTPESGIVGGWEYQWLVVVPEASGSWVLPLEVGRRGPQAGTATQVAIAQVRAAQAARGAEGPRPLLLLDSHYDVPDLVQADLGLDVLARLASNRRFHRPPEPRASGPGAPRKHGPVFRCHDPATHGVPDRTQTNADPTYGQVTVDVWERLHAQPTPHVEVTVLRVRLARLPRREQPPQPLWLVWHGGSLPDDLRTVWRWYQRRFAVEHAFRLLKHDLGWTTIRPRAPLTADRWSWLLAAGLWQVWLARALVAETRLPWERRQPPAARSPGRVRRGLAAILLALGTPARLPQPRGKSPGRHVGQCPGPAPRFPVQRRGPPLAA
jgi:DDE superfamily endonuclease